MMESKLNSTQEYLMREIRTIRSDLAVLLTRKNELLVKYNVEKQTPNETKKKLLQANLADNLRIINGQIKRKESRLKILTTKLAKETKE